MIDDIGALMKVKKHTTQPTALGITLYYDNSGNKTGVSEISPQGETVYYEIKQLG